MYMILRVIRGILGLSFGTQIADLVNGLLQLIRLLQLNTSESGGHIFAIMIVKIIFAVILGYLFFGLRTFINWLHTKNLGVPHPSLEKKWSL